MNPLIDQEDELQLLQAMEPDDEAAAAAGGMPPASPRDALREYFAPSQSGGDIAGRLKTAQDSANKNRFQARMAQAAANLGASIARAQPLDQKPFNELAEGADEPLKQTEKQIALQSTQDKVLRDYFTKMESNKLRQKQYEGVEKYREGMLANHSKRTDALNALGGRRLDQGDKRIGLQEEQHAAQVADKFRTDKVMMTTSNQGQQLDKALGRIADIKSGKTQFTTSMKADLEKDLANVISGGTSSSLGQLGRIEFDSYATQWQHAMDKLNGFQGDINSPEYLAQLEQTFNGLKHDIAKIQASRAKKIAATMKTAFSNNKLASQAIQDNVENSEFKETPRAPNPQLDAAKKWLQEHPKDPQAAAVQEKIRKMEMGA